MNKQKVQREFEEIHNKILVIAQVLERIDCDEVCSQTLMKASYLLGSLSQRCEFRILECQDAFLN